MLLLFGVQNSTLMVRLAQCISRTPMMIKSMECSDIIASIVNVGGKAIATTRNDKNREVW